LILNKSVLSTKCIILTANKTQYTYNGYSTVDVVDAGFLFDNAAMTC